MRALAAQTKGIEQFVVDCFDDLPQPGQVGWGQFFLAERFGGVMTSAP